MKKIFKKNQIIITALALMIAIAGYLQYTRNEVSDKEALKEVNSDLSEDTYEISDEDAFTPEDIFTDTEDNSGTEDQNADAAVDTQGEAVAEDTQGTDTAMADAGVEG